MFKKAKHWFLILLVCVLFVGLIPGKASAATSDNWLYNGVSLPPLPTEYSEATYAVITEIGNPTSSYYRLDMATVPMVVGPALGSNEALRVYDGWNVVYFITVENPDVWSYSETWSNPYQTGDYVGAWVTENPVIWSSFDLYRRDSTSIFFRGSIPVRNELPAAPVFRVNLPRNYVYDYEAGDNSVSLYVDAYSSDGYTVEYTWMIETNGRWAPAQAGTTGTQYFKPPTDTQGVFRYMCRVSTTDGVWTSTADSNPVYVLVDSSLNIPEGDSTTISPGDQVIIDQMGQIGDDVGSIKDSIESLPDDIVDGVQDALENERNEAESTGNELIDDLVNVIPDIGADGKNALEPLLIAIRYEGREPALTLPALVLPEIDGLWERTTLLPAQTIEFAGYVDLVPQQLLALVQVLTMLAMAVFIIKDVYGIIQYFATLRGAAE